MTDSSTDSATPQGVFESINPGYNSVFSPNRLTIGLVIPIENYSNSPVPTMKHHIEHAQMAEQLGFSAIWLRDVPFNVPGFGDAGQMFDPFVYLGMLTATTDNIALGVASVVLPLRHPAHVAKSAASADVLSEGRLILGVASGDRPEEYPALNLPFDNRGERFRSSFEYIRHMWEDRAAFENPYGSPYGGMDMLPKPCSGKLPMLITGASQQDPEWIAAHGEGWITYPRGIGTQARIIESWRSRIRQTGGYDKPAMQSLYIDLLADPDAPAQPIHLGFRLGINALRDYLKAIQQIGINHVAINLRLNRAGSETTMNTLSDQLLPEFHQEPCA